MGEIVDSRIEGVLLERKKTFKDERGCVFHFAKRTDHLLQPEFGEIYISSINAGFAKGWKKHTHMTQSVAVPKGAIRVYLVDDRPQSGSYKGMCTVYLGEKDYKKLTFPPNIWYCFESDYPDTSIIVSFLDEPHDSSEVVHIDYEGDVPMQKFWSKYFVEKSLY